MKIGRLVLPMLPFFACVGRPAAPPPPAASASVASAPASHEGMVAIPAGRFAMGSTSGRPNEQPVHEVEVGAFFLDSTEVTVAAYARCVHASACEPVPDGDGCNANRADKQTHPVNCVDWKMADAYCRWAKKRLPTEEEWEYAARGTDGRRYPWGTTPPDVQDVCWGRYSSNEGTCPVGSFPKDTSPFGLRDMSGNVSEWTSSKYSDDYKSPDMEMLPVVRGGGWQQSGESWMSATNRFDVARTNSSPVIGFRCAAPSK